MALTLGLFPESCSAFLHWVVFGGTRECHLQRWRKRTFMVSWWAGGRDSTRSRMHWPRRDRSWISAREGGHGGVLAPAVTASLSPPPFPSSSHPNLHLHHPPDPSSCIHSHPFSTSFLSPTPSLHPSSSHFHSIPVPIPSHPTPCPCPCPCPSLMAAMNLSKWLKGTSGSGSSRRKSFSAPVTTWMSSQRPSSRSSCSSGGRTASQQSPRDGWVVPGSPLPCPSALEAGIPHCPPLSLRVTVPCSTL